MLRPLLSAMWLTIAACSPGPNRESLLKTEACRADPVLARPPIGNSELLALRPMGVLYPPDHTLPTPHMYWITNDPETGTGKSRVEVRAPAKLYVTGAVVRAFDEYRGKPNVRSYDLDVLVCADVEGYFINLMSVDDPKVRAAISALEASKKCDLSVKGFDDQSWKNQRGCSVTFDPAIAVEEGALLGTAGDIEIGFTGIDFGIRDYRRADGRSGYANPARQCDVDGRLEPLRRQNRSHCYATSPLALMSEETLRPLLPLLRSEDGTARTTEPRVGNPLPLDVSGSAQGFWYESEAILTPQQKTARGEGPEARDLFLGPEPYDATAQVVSTGLRFATAPTPLTQGRYVYEPEVSGSINPRFSDTKTGVVYCLERLATSVKALRLGSDTPIDRVVVFQLADDGMSIAVDVQAGAHCAAAPALGPSSVRFFR